MVKKELLRFAARTWPFTWSQAIVELTTDKCSTKLTVLCNVNMSAECDEKRSLTRTNTQRMNIERVKERGCAEWVWTMELEWSTRYRKSCLLLIWNRYERRVHTKSKSKWCAHPNTNQVNGFFDGKPQLQQQQHEIGHFRPMGLCQLTKCCENKIARV